MSTTAPSSKVIDASALFESLTFRTGVSAKTGNPYIIGSVKIKKPNGSLRCYDNSSPFVLLSIKNMVLKISQG